MMVISYLSFVVLGIIAGFVQYAAIKARREPVIGNNPHFVQFQRLYFMAYLPALLADWLQNPYLYKLYSHYGFEETQIAVLYCCGFASTVLLGTWTPVAADKFGRKKLCFVFTLIYSVACFLKLSSSYMMLIIGRILGGVATSLLFSAFEAWYISEHIQTHDFPVEWIPVTFAKTQVWNGVLAIVGGVVGNMVAEWMGFGPVAPFMLAIPCLIFSGLVVISQWPENYSKQKIQFGKTCMEGLRNIVLEPKIFLIGIIQSLFESAMYIFIFIWTPVLAPGNPSLGIIFSSFMVCIMLGSGLFHLLASKRVPVLNLLCLAIVLGLLGNVLCVLTTHPENTNLSAVYVAFLLIEVAVGVYYPAMSLVRSKLVPETKLRGILNWFRVPLNLIACGILMALHDDTFRHGNRLIFVVNAALLGLASLAALRFLTMVKHDSELTSHLEEDDALDGENGCLLESP